MPKNSSGGNKAKRQGNKNTANKNNEQRPLKLKDSEQQYGKCTCIYGGSPCYIGVKCEDGIERRVVLRGKMRNIRVQAEDFLLVLINSPKDGECEYKYFPAEVFKLKEDGHLDERIFDDERGAIGEEDALGNDDDNEEYGDEKIDAL